MKQTIKLFALLTTMLIILGFAKKETPLQNTNPSKGKPIETAEAISGPEELMPFFLPITNDEFYYFSSNYDGVFTDKNLFPKEFSIESQSLQENVQNIYSNYSFVHFCFINLKDFMANKSDQLSYFIVFSNKKNLNVAGDSFLNDVVFYVDNNKLVTVKNEIAADVVKKFKKGKIGIEIKKLSKISKITEYITYHRSDIKDYFEKNNSSNIYLRMLLISKNINCGSSSDCQSRKPDYENNHMRLAFAVLSTISSTYNALKTPSQSDTVFDQGDLRP